MLDVFDPKFLNSSNSMVLSLWTQLHAQALKARGSAFSFRYEVHQSTEHYRYTAHIFSPDGWDYISHYENRNLETLFREAVEILQPYLRTWHMETEVTEDTRSAVAEPGARAIVIKTYVACFDVSLIDSMRIFISYENEGSDFKFMLLQEYRSLLDQVIPNLNLTVTNYLQGGVQIPLTFYPRVSSTEVFFDQRTMYFSGMGMQPLKTVSMRYGFLTALIERAVEQLQNYGTVTWEINPYYQAGEVQMCGRVELKVRNQDLKAW